MLLHIFTDGSCVPNPGEMRIGVAVMQGRTAIHTISKTMGQGTSNQAELLAIREALLWANPEDDLTLHVDSKYALGVVSKGWNVSRNIELVFEIRRLLRKFTRLKFQKVKGHAGIHGNELADQLAGA